ncbi:hypothetical protein F290043J8_18430 [Mediterraneibacter gnavus]
MYKVVFDILLVILSIINAVIQKDKASKIWKSVWIVLWSLVTFHDLISLL